MPIGSLDAVFAGLPRSSIWPREVGAEVMAQPESLGTGRPGAGWRAPAPAPAAETAHADPQSPAPAAAGHVPDGSRALRAAEEAIAADDPISAAIQLALALRASPALAPAVLDLARDQTGPAFDVIRGDAFRLVGREGEARRSFAAAATRQDGDELPATRPLDSPHSTTSSDPELPDLLEGS